MTHEQTNLSGGWNTNGHVLAAGTRTTGVKFSNATA